MGIYQDPSWPEGRLPNWACSCDEVFEWPRGVAFDGESYRCPTCKGVIAKNLISDHKIIPRSEFLGVDPLEMVSSAYSPISSIHTSTRQPENGWRNLFIILVVGLAVTIFVSSRSEVGYVNSPVQVNEQTPPDGGPDSPVPSINNYYYEEPCEDTFTREEYQDCLEGLWMKDYELDMKYNFGEP